MRDGPVGSEAEDALAIDIGRAVLDAHRTASQIVSDAQRQAETLVESAHMASGVRDPAQKRLILERLLQMMEELDRVEAELQRGRGEMVRFLDRFVASSPRDRQ